MITNDQITQAEAEAHAAEQARLKAEAAYSKGGARPDLYRALDDATLSASHAAARLRTLRADLIEQGIRLKARAEAVATATKSLAGAVKKLTASRDGAVQAVIAAEKAARAALSALNDHDQLVRSVAADLRSRGLTLDNGEEMGAGRDGWLRVNGEEWRPVDGPSLLDTVVRSAVAAENPRHPLGRAVRLTYGGPSATRGSNALLARMRQSQ